MWIQATLNVTGVAVLIGYTTDGQLPKLRGL
jgi:hypothetical protein